MEHGQRYVGFVCHLLGEAPIEKLFEEAALVRNHYSEVNIVHGTVFGQALYYIARSYAFKMCFTRSQFTLV